MRIIEQDPRRNLNKSASLFPQPFSLDMEILTTAPNFIALFYFPRDIKWPLCPNSKWPGHQAVQVINNLVFHKMDIEFLY